MAEYLIKYKSHWYDLEPQVRKDELNIDGKFDCRDSVGDIIEIQENGHWINSDDSIRRGWSFNNLTFVILKTTNETKAQAMQYLKQWIRTFDYSMDLRDDVLGIYEYTITLTNLSISGKELFTIRDRFLRLPERVTVIGRGSNYVRLRLTLPAEWTLAQKTEKRLWFQNEGKEQIKDLMKVVARRKFYIDLNAIPQSYKDLLSVQGWLKGTATQLNQYIKDKAN